MGVDGKGDQIWTEQGESKIWISGLANWVGVSTLHRGRIIRKGVRFCLVGRVMGVW